jgi:hypothetical protein
VDALTTSRRGSLTLAYGVRRPLARRVYCLDADGRLFHVIDADEPVETAIVSPDGQFAAVAAGAHVYFLRSSPKGIRQKSFSLSGEPRHLQFGPADSLYIAYREPERVELVKSTGRVLWRRQGASITDYSIITDRNQRRWWTTRPGRAPLVRLCADGSAVMLSYEHKVEHSSQSRYERRLAYLPGGQGGWTKGGPFVEPIYVAAEARGDGRPRPPRFRLYSREGASRWRYEVPAGIMIATASAHGRHIAAYRTDGIMEVVRVTSP